jgi:hypothetical protein
VIVRFATTAATNVHMQTESKRIEVQFPANPAANALIRITNQGVTVWERNAGDLQDALVLNEQTPFIENALEYRGIPESALHE